MTGTLKGLKRLAARAGVALVVFFAALFVAQPRGLFVASGEGQDLRKFNQFVQTSNSPSLKMLREGRDLIDGERWAEAAGKFSEFVAAYPKDKDVDVALYWLAYSLKQQAKFREASQHLGRLLKEFPGSNWAEEATAMLAEIAPQTGDTRVIDNAMNANDEEIKIVALQSLFESSPARAMAYVTDILKPGSKASRSFKEAALSLLASHGERQSLPLLLDIARTQEDPELRAVAIRGLADHGGESVFDELVKLYDAERDREVKEHILHSFEGIESARVDAKLLDIARAAGEHTELRKAAIRTLGNKNGPAAIEPLAQIYRSETNREIREQALNSLSDIEDPRAQSKLVEIARGEADTELRRFAIHRLGDKEGAGAFDELVKIYQSERDVEVKKDILRAFGHMESRQARERIAEAARSETDPELRKTAIHVLAEDEENPQTVETLIAMYDAERDVEIKADILDALAETEQKRALRKVMDVARRETNTELRKKAVSLLGHWEDPEAAKFLEELLKP